MFGGVVWWWGHGSEPGIKFLTGYLVEKALSMDNIFVFVVIFRFFGIPLKYQYRVLFWGILGAIVMRLAFILAGIELIERFDWVMPLFGLFLIYTGFKLARHSDTEVHPEKNIVLRIARRLFRSPRDHRGTATVSSARKRPLVHHADVSGLLVIESTDVLFAVDSVPAVFGITKDPFIAFSSNIFAILGLRALYFLLAGVMDLFPLSDYGLAAVLVFVGVKMLGEFWTDTGMKSCRPWVSLVSGRCRCWGFRSWRRSSRKKRETRGESRTRGRGE